MTIRRSTAALEPTTVTAAAMTAEVARRGEESRIARVLRAPASWLVLLVGLSTAVRAAIGIRVPSPWILPDEVVYSDLAKSIAAGHRPAVRGVPVFGWGEVYPTLIAPAWALFSDPMHAYHAALVISALVMSLAAVPAYLLARLFVSQRASFLVAAMTVLVPSMTYTSVVMTENAAYPVFLLAVLLIARAIWRPSAVNQVLAVLGLGLMAFTRIQGLALVGAYLCGVLIYGLLGTRAERSAYLRRFVPTGVFLGVATLAPAVASTLAGDGASGWLGSRSSTFAEFHAREVPQWLAYLAGDLVLYVAVIPVAASVVVMGRGLIRRGSEKARLFTAVALPTFAATLVSISLVSASLDVDGKENLNERYVFYVLPLLFVGLALWIREELPRSRPFAPLVVAACGALVVALPIHRLGYNAEFQSPGLLPWFKLPLGSVALVVSVVGVVVGAGALWLTCPPGRTGRLWVATLVWMSLLSVVAVGQQRHPAKYYANAYADARPDWVDTAVGGGTSVAVLWDQRLVRRGSPDFFYYWLAVTEFFNASVGDVYSVGGPTYYETFLPTIPARTTTDGTVLDPQGRTVRAHYVLATCRAPVKGRVIREASRGVLQLVEVDGPVRLAQAGRCRRPKP